MIEQELFDRPAMIRQPRRHRWRPFPPLPPVPRGDRLPQAPVWGTEVIDAAKQKQGGIDRLRGARQSTGATGKTTESFNVGGVDDTALLGAGEQVSKQSLRALHDPSFNGQRSPLPLLDHLRDEQLRPSKSAWASALTGVEGSAEGLLESTHITLPAIHRQQEGAFACNLADLAD